MEPRIEETIYADVITSASNGAAADADSTPTCEVFEDATDTAILTPTVTKRTGKTGNYRIPIACTAANGFEIGKSYNVIASATVGGVAAKAVMARFVLRSAVASDTPRTVDQDYLGEGRLIVEDPAGNPIAGATVTAYLAADYAAQGGSAAAVESTTTDTSGGWTLSLEPAEYTLTFAFAGQLTRSTFVVT